MYGALNEEQRAAVTTGPGPVLVIAAAGSGKTRVVTSRVCHLVGTGTPARDILLLTFTNKAANEMMERVTDLGQVDAAELVGGTFHRVALRILRRHADVLGFPTQFTLLDQEDSRDVLKLCLDEQQGLGLHGLKPAEVHSIVSLSLNTDERPADILADRMPSLADYGIYMEDIATAYAARKRALGAMDFDDLLWFLRKLLREHEDIGDLYANRFQYILVDEYQDTNQIQADLVDLLAKKHKNLMVVGDDFQSIYSFRGAHFENILSFPNRYPEARIHRLQYNYRSTPEILAVANRTIEHNVRQFPKVLKAVRPEGETPALIPASSPTEQARFISSRIHDLQSDGRALRDIAILYRSHYHSLELQIELTREGLPYIIRSGVRFFEQAHVKDILAVMRVIYNPRDEVSWLRILKLLPRIGKVTATKVVKALREANYNLEALPGSCRKAVSSKGRQAYDDFVELIQELTELVTPSETIQSILHADFGNFALARHEDAENRAEDLEQLSDYALKFATVEDFLSDLALLSGMTEDTGDGHGDFLTLTTIHQAKGLEWPVVFVLWMVEGRFPSARSLGSAEDEEEERRLFYVTVTRARDELYLCYPQMSYSARQGAMIHKASRFLEEVGEDYLERWEVGSRSWDF